MAESNAGKPQLDTKTTEVNSPEPSMTKRNRPGRMAYGAVAVFLQVPLANRARTEQILQFLADAGLGFLERPSRSIPLRTVVAQAGG